MTEPLDEKYLVWLYERTGQSPSNPRKEYWSLMRQLFTKEFVWIIPNDDNRVEDGRDLRYRFLEEQRIKKVDPDWMILGCSMLELLIGLANRLEFEGGGLACNWFWQLITNLDLDKYDDTYVKKKSTCTKRNR